MAESPPPPVTRRPRRSGRRVILFLLIPALALAGLAGVIWWWRVPVLNRLLAAAGNPLWKVEVARFDYKDGQWQAAGLQVSHVDQPEPVFTAARLATSAGWSALKIRNLGDVTLEGAALHWRSGLRENPVSSQKPSTGEPLVTWDSLRLTQGKIDVADAGFYSFTGTVSSQGGAGAWHDDGRLFLDPQTLVFSDPHYRMTLEEGPVQSFEVTARQLDLEGSVEAETGLLAVSRAHFTGGKAALAATFTPAPESASEPAPDPAAPPEPEPEPEPDESAGPEPRGTITMVKLSGLSAPELKLEGTLPWTLGLRSDLTLAGLQAGTGLPFTIDGLRLEKAGAKLPAGAEVPDFSLSGSYSGTGRLLESFTFAGAEVPDVPALMAALGWEAPPGLTASFAAGGQLSNLDFQPGAALSSSLQTITATSLKLNLPDGQGTLTAPRLHLAAIPDEVNLQRRLRLLELTAPQADLLLPPAFSGESSVLPLPADPASPPPENPSRPLWEGWTADVLTLTDGSFAAVLPQAGGGRVTTALGISTTAVTPDNAEVSSPHYQINLTKPQLTHPEFPDQPIALAATIQLTASAFGLWQRREIDSLTLAGSRLQIGEALFRLVSSIPPAPPPAPVPPPVPSAVPSSLPLETSPPWRLRQLVLDDSLVQLDHLGDGRRLDIPVKRQEFRDLPLDTTALAAVDRLYKIEVPNITLYNPFSVGQKVAVLDTNYIQFTPSGLLERRLERVDLMAPSLYAGQPLFDFVEATRKRFETLAAGPPSSGRDPDAPLLVDTRRDSPATVSALARVSPSEVAAAAAWNIPFYTESGKVYVAPKGVPWPNLPVIPFRNARDTNGQPIPFLLKGETFHGELAIEPGWYEFPEYKVRLRLSDRGRIIFNTPQKDRDNNLTEVFENNTLIFRQLQIDKAWLSVTYDARGIYARFGGLTCGGTLTGGINLYLDELYTWDGWTSLTGIGMKPLTDKLTPDTFRMSGTVDELTVKAYGDTTSLYQASLDLKVTQPGQLQVLALDGLKGNLQSLGGLQADLGEIGIDTLRNFDYTGCTGNLRLFGTEGQGQLALTGPGGSRTFNLRLHDYRARAPKVAAPF